LEEVTPQGAEFAWVTVVRVPLLSDEVLYCFPLDEGECEGRLATPGVEGWDSFVQA
jgi:hypothetical protein